MHVQKQSSDVIAHQWRLESAELICHFEMLSVKIKCLCYCCSIMTHKCASDSVDNTDIPRIHLV